jgi:DNA repair protein RecO (recombination protein O)
MAQGHVSDVVTGCETLESFQPLRDDLGRLSRALYAAELIDRMTVERAPGFGAYRLLLDTLRRLQDVDNADLAVRSFEMRLMVESGFRPELERCVVCGLALQEEQNFFAPQGGGAVCPGCVGGLAGTRALTVNALKVLRLLQRGSYNDMARLKMAASLAEEVERHLRSYIVCVLERDVNAAAFIERLRREDLRDTVKVKV